MLRSVRLCRHPIRTEPAITRNRRHRWLALRTGQKPSQCSAAGTAHFAATAPSSTRRACAPADRHGSGEIIIEAIIAASALYLFFVHTFTAKPIELLAAVFKQDRQSADAEAECTETEPIQFLISVVIFVTP